jgi:phage terminase small subunit
MSKLHNLDPKRRRFVEEYAVDWNATQAAIRAGYSPKTAQQQGSRLLLNVVVQEALAEVMQTDAERCNVTVNQVIDETAKLAFVNMMDYLRISPEGDPYVDLSALTRAQAAGLLHFECHDYKDGRGEDARDVRKVRIKLNPGKLTALVKLGERLGVWKPEGGEGQGLEKEYAQIVADEKLRVQNMEEIAGRYLPKPKPEKAKKAE